MLTYSERLPYVVDIALHISHSLKIKKALREEKLAFIPRSAFYSLVYSYLYGYAKKVAGTR